MRVNDISRFFRFPERFVADPAFDSFSQIRSRARLRLMTRSPNPMGERNAGPVSEPGSSRVVAQRLPTVERGGSRREVGPGSAGAYRYSRITPAVYGSCAAIAGGGPTSCPNARTIRTRSAPVLCQHLAQSIRHLSYRRSLAIPGLLQLLLPRLAPHIDRCVGFSFSALSTNT
jgi:hypothetical protein